LLEKLTSSIFCECLLSFRLKSIDKARRSSKTRKYELSFTIQSVQVSDLTTISSTPFAQQGISLRHDSYIGYALATAFQSITMATVTGDGNLADGDGVDADDDDEEDQDDDDADKGIPNNPKRKFTGVPGAPVSTAVPVSTGDPAVDATGNLSENPDDQTENSLASGARGSGRN
jgi:hypothetical protein